MQAKVIDAADRFAQRRAAHRAAVGFDYYDAGERKRRRWDRVFAYAGATLAAVSIGVGFAIVFGSKVLDAVLP